jgi:hypothetical protein
MGRELGDEDDVVTQLLWRQTQALIFSHRRRHDEAERLASDAVARSEQTDMLNAQGDALCDLATVLEGMGRPAETRATLILALERFERKHNRAMVTQVQRRLRVDRDADSSQGAYQER